MLGQPNFGTIEIDWNSRPVNLKFQVRDKNGAAVASVNISLSELHPSNSKTGGNKVKTGDNKRHCTLEVSLPWITRYRPAILFSFTIVGKSLLNSNCQIFFLEKSFYDSL